MGIVYIPKPVWEPHLHILPAHSCLFFHKGMKSWAQHMPPLEWCSDLLYQPQTGQAQRGQSANILNGSRRWGQLLADSAC